MVYHVEQDIRGIAGNVDAMPDISTMKILVSEDAIPDKSMVKIVVADVKSTEPEVVVRYQKRVCRRNWKQHQSVS